MRRLLLIIPVHRLSLYRFVVEDIVNHEKKKGVVRFEVKWVGYESTENTWEPVDNILP